jgi:RNA polymerase-binding transcription factor DksA
LLSIYITRWWIEHDISDGHDMNRYRKNLEELKAILSKRLKRLKESGIEELLQSLCSKSPWKFDQNLHRALLYALANRRMRNVIKAIDRLDEGIYEKCVKCDHNIDKNHLELLPTATHC